MPSPSECIGMQPGQSVSPWAAFPFTTPLTSRAYSIGIPPHGVPVITWQVITPSAPTSFTVNLQGSTDGINYSTIDSATAEGLKTISGSYKFIRFTVSAVSGGSSPTLTVLAVYSIGTA